MSDETDRYAASGNPVNDAILVGSMFKKAGFDLVDVRQDLNAPEMRKVLREFTKVLTPLVERGTDCKVKVGAHGSHGSIATVTLVGAPEDKPGAVAGEVHKLLDPFVMRHEVVFG